MIEKQTESGLGRLTDRLTQTEKERDRGGEGEGGGEREREREREREDGRKDRQTAKGG